MRTRVTAALGAIALIAAACGGTPSAAREVPRVTITSIATTTTSAPATTAAPTTTAAPRTAAAPTTTAAAAPDAPASSFAPTQAFGTVEITGTPLPNLPPEGSDPAVGTPIPGLSGHDFTGAPVEISDDGRAKMIVFLAHWCPYCQRELPLVQEWLEGDPLPEGVDVYAVATLTRPEGENFPPSAWFERNAWSAPVIVDDTFDSAAAAYGLSAVPYWVIVGADGNLVVRGSGGVPPEVLSEIAAAIAP